MNLENRPPWIEYKIARNIISKIKKRYIELIVNNNSLLFNNKNDTHTLITALGTKMAAIYTTITLPYLGDNLYENVAKNTTTV